MMKKADKVAATAVMWTRLGRCPRNIAVLSSPIHRGFSTSLNEMKLKRYELPQWYPDRRKMKDRPKELGKKERSSLPHLAVLHLFAWIYRYIVCFSLYSLFAAMWDKLREYPVAPPSLTMIDLVKQQSQNLAHKDGYTSLHTPVKHDWSFPFISVRLLKETNLAGLESFKSTCVLGNCFLVLQYASRAVGAGFIDLGFKKGDKFLTWCMNGPEHHLLNLGGPQAGAVHIALPPEASVEAVKYVIETVYRSLCLPRIIQ